MVFAEPGLLWGALAVAVPVALHFWHRQRGRLRPWAATQWLAEMGQPPSRGLRLNNVALLLIRCLGLLVLVILLSGPRVKSNGTIRVQRIHLVQPNASVTANFRFELSEALAKQEPVYWIGEPVQPMTDLQQLPARPVFNRRALQASLNSLRSQNAQLHLYVVNSRTLADGPALTVPNTFRLHTAPDAAPSPRAYLLTKNGQRLYVNEAGILTSASNPALRLGTAPAHTGPIRVRLAYRNPVESQTVQAALTALTDVYGLDLAFDDASRRTADWVLTDRLPDQPEAQTLYVVSGVVAPVTATNHVVAWPEPLTPQTSARVRDGRLPEWLAEPLLAHYGLTNYAAPLSRPELNALFITDPQPAGERPAEPVRSGLTDALTGLLIGLLMLERWLALSRNA